MNWRRLMWLVILLLILSIVWEAVELKGSYEDLSSARSGNTSSTTTKLLSLQKRIDAHRAHLSDLEQPTLWDSDSDFMSWVTQQADGAGVQVIGVEHLPVEKLPEYQCTTVSVSVRGDYNSLGRFINKVERSANAVKINSFRMRRKEYIPEYVTMDLSLSYFQRTERAA